MDEDEVCVGFRFYPTEEELVSFYLQNKLKGTTPEIDRVIPFLDIYDYNPSDLPRLGGDYSPADGEQWFFFGRRHCGGGCFRPNRLTNWGYWKASGSPAHVYSSQNRVIGRKRTMVFYAGRFPNATKTLWKMTEYYAFSSSKPPQLIQQVYLCRIYKCSKSLGAFDRRPLPSDALSDPAVPDNSSSLAVVKENPTDGEILWDFELQSWSDLLSNDEELLQLLAE